MVTATDLMPGHRLRIEVTSSNFPNYERNLNSGGRNFDESRAEVAKNRVLHRGGSASFVEYTELPR
jgi:predicted acyl esterase